MSTRAAYFFKDDDTTFMVYKHHDGYPTGAVQWLQMARALSWTGGRFEADEAAASFACAAKLSSQLMLDADNNIIFEAGQLNKYKTDRGGGTRLMHMDPEKADMFAYCSQCSDIEYAYLVTSKAGAWYVEAYTADIPYDQSANKKHFKKVFAGPIDKMTRWAVEFEKKAA